ncbi:MAG: hypothetical protein LBR25_03250 [Erysipelotrichaceae bacterium]|jgi:hypothetical protein|nr:hypothetical protein [Erysipelotrichaceae bacterium]
MKKLLCVLLLLGLVGCQKGGGNDKKLVCTFDKDNLTTVLTFSGDPLKSIAYTESYKYQTFDSTDDEGYLELLDYYASFSKDSEISGKLDGDGHPVITVSYGPEFYASVRKAMFPDDYENDITLEMVDAAEADYYGADYCELE